LLLAVGPGAGLLGAASIGALAACMLIVVIGVAARRPLARLPENTLKFAVGILLSAFGVYGPVKVSVLPGRAAIWRILGIAALFSLMAIATVAFARHPTRAGAGH